MNETDIIIIGAGAAGLMCARELGKAGKKVIVFEATKRIGGRIYTITDNGFPIPVELGAEFIHGDLPLTKQLLKEAGIDYYKIKGEIWRSQKGVFLEQDDFIEGIDEVIKKLKELPTDSSVKNFLDLYFSGGKYTNLRKTLKSYVEGYDAADTKRASAFALLQELLGEDNNQYRIKGGYVKLIDHLFTECRNAGCIFKLQTIVKEIRWKKGYVKVKDQTGNSVTAKKIVITVPLGVLQSPKESISHIIFSPAIKEIQQAINTLGCGSVIKVILQFNEEIWKYAENRTQKNKKSGPGFLFSDAVIPTWWTQLPEKNGMITGWLAGPKAARLQEKPDDKILNLALESLAVIFKIPRTKLLSAMTGSYIHNWSTDHFSRGAYSYETVESKNAKRIINNGVENTIEFAGEAYYEGTARGTVEAALVNGQQKAKKISKNTSP